MTSSPVIGIVRSDHDLEHLADEWRQLSQRTGGGPFSDYDWFHIWWTHLAKPDAANSLHVVTARRDSRLVAVLPLYVARRKGIRVVQEGGHKAFNSWDMLAEQDADAVAAWDGARQSPFYDFANIREVYAGTMGHTTLSSFAHKRDVVGAFGVKASSTHGEDYLLQLSHSRRYEYRSSLRRMGKVAPVSFGICRNNPVPLEIVDAMVRHKVDWAHTHHQQGLLFLPNVQEFFRQWVQKAAEQGRLALTWLKCGEDVVAYNFALLHNDTAIASTRSYDPAWARYAPGNAVMILSVIWAIDNGFATVDMGQGGGYKASFCNASWECAEFTFASSLRGKLLEWAFIFARKLSRRIRGVHAETKQDAQAATKLKRDV